MKVNNKAKGIISLFLAFAIITSMILNTVSFSVLASNKTLSSSLSFYSMSIPVEMMDYFNDILPSIRHIIVDDIVEMEISVLDLTIGTAISIGNNDDLFYIPLLANGEVVYIICISIVEDIDNPYRLVFGKLFSDEINSLNSSEIYTLINHNSSLYAVGNESVNLLISEGYYSSEDEEFINNFNIETSTSNHYGSEIFSVNEINNMDVVDIKQATGFIPFLSTTGEGQKNELFMPFIWNGGLNGYCWLAATSSIVNYLGRYAHTPQSLHDLVDDHQDHTLYYCPGGYDSDVKNLLFKFSAVYEDTQYLPYYYVMDYIDNNAPIYVNMLLRDGKLAHAIVICGYDDTAMSSTIIYRIMDSNIGKINVTTPVYETINYNLNGDRYIYYSSIAVFGIY